MVVSCNGHKSDSINNSFLEELHSIMRNKILCECGCACILITTVFTETNYFLAHVCIVYSVRFSSTPSLRRV